MYRSTTRVYCSSGKFSRLWYWPPGQAKSVTPSIDGLPHLTIGPRLLGIILLHIIAGFMV